MKKRILAWVLALVMIVGLLPTVAFAADLSGSGTKDDPYLIATADDLATFRDLVNKTAKKSTSTLCGKLTANIDLSSLSGDWTPIATATNTYSDYVAYGGTFDGAGYTISGLHIDNAKTYQALFGYVKGGTIKNLTVEGSVTTAATSSAYAAGIVAYGNAATMENCTNKVNVTGTKKGYVAGIAASVSGATKITGCINAGKIAATGEYIGGIIGSGSGSPSVIGCINNGTIESTGKPGSYNYNVGGIAGSLSGATMERCGNTGAINSTIKRTGGVVGGFGGTMEACFNTGTVTGIYALGGVVGGFGSKDSKITDCYNLGNVVCKAPTPSFSDSNAKGVGGVVGDPSSTSYTGEVLKNCYNAGTITNNDNTTADITVGGVIGSGVAKNYKGEATAALITATNCYYLAQDALPGDGADASASGVTAKTESELKASDMPGLLGGSYVADAKGGYPILSWQDPTAEYTVTFTLSPEDAALTVSQDGVPIDPVSGHTYELTNGDYAYKVTADEHDDAAGTFTVAYGGQSINVSLNIKLYTVKFEIDPDEGAVLVVDGQTPEVADGRTYRLPKSDSQYSYSIKAFGYQDVNDTFSVIGDETADTQSVTLTALDTYPVTVGAITAADNKSIDPTVTVTCPAWSKTMTAEADGSYRLPNGSYHYTISCSGYKSVSGDFTVENSAASIPATVLEVQTAWDGESYDVPTLIDGVYHADRHPERADVVQQRSTDQPGHLR